MIFPEERRSYLRKEKLHSGKKSSGAMIPLSIKLYINF